MPSDDPFAEGHEDRTPPELYAVRPGGGPANSPGWTVRVVPNLFPALIAAASSRDGERDGAHDGGAKSDARASGAATRVGRGAPELFESLPASGAHEVIINGPQSVLSLAELAREQVIGAVDAWRERMRAHAGSACVQLIVNERREAGASLPHTHAQLYALDFVPATVARERERASAYTTRTMGQSLLGDLVAEEVRRRERIVAIDEEAVLMAPYASRLPFQLMLAPRTPRARFEDRRTIRRVAAARRPVPAGALPRLEPAAEPVGAHGAARHRGLLLAHRHACRASPTWRASSCRPTSTSTSSRPSTPRPCCGRRERSLRSTGTMAARGTLPTTLRGRAAAGGAAVRPLGRAAVAGVPQRRAAARRATRTSASRGAIAWYPDRTWHGHTYVPGTALTSTGYELFGYVRFLPGLDDDEPSELSAHVDFTDETAERNPDWTLDLCDEIIGAWRGETGAVAAMTLVWGRPLIAGGRDRHGRARRPRGRPVRADRRALHADRPRRLPPRPARDQAVRRQGPRARARVAVRRGGG